MDASRAAIYAADARATAAQRMANDARERAFGTEDPELWAAYDAAADAADAAWAEYDRAWAEYDRARAIDRRAVPGPA